MSAKFYKLKLTPSEWKAVLFSGSRYEWSDGLMDMDYEEIPGGGVVISGTEGDWWNWADRATVDDGLFSLAASSLQGKLLTWGEKLGLSFDAKENPRARRRSTGGQHTRYIGDAAITLEHFGDGNYEAEIALVRDGEVVWEESLHARPSGDPDSDAVIDRMAATAVKLAVFESGNDLVKDATAWAVDGQGGYEVQRGNPEGPPPGVPWSRGKKNPDGEVWSSFGERTIKNRKTPQLVAVRLVQEPMGWLVDHTETVAGAWMPWETALSDTYFKTKEAAEKAARAWARDENIALEGFELRTRRNPAGLTAKGERMYEHVKESYPGDPRAKEIAARTVLARAASTPGLKKNPSHEEILRAAGGGTRTPAVEAWIRQYPKTWESMKKRAR